MGIIKGSTRSLDYGSYRGFQALGAPKEFPRIIIVYWGLTRGPPLEEATIGRVYFDV